MIPLSLAFHGFVMFILLGLGIFGLAGVHRLVQSNIESQLSLGNAQTKYFNVWVNPADFNETQFYSIFLMNVTNVPQVLKGEQPKLEEVGPYTFIQNQWKDKDSVNWRANGTIQYRSHTTYTFVPSKSLNAKDGRQLSVENDVFFHVNLGLLAVAEMFESVPGGDDALMEFLELIIDSHGVTFFEQHFFQDVVFGYNDTILLALQQLLPQKVTSTRVGLLSPDDPRYWQNPSECHTGVDTAPLPQGVSRPVDAIGWMTMFSGMRTLEGYWGTSYANMLNGSSDGFHPNVQDDEVLPFFVDTLYRSIHMERLCDITLHDVPLKRLVFSKSTLANMTTNPDNAAFYINFTGTFPLPPILFAPILVTKPYFLDAPYMKPYNVSIDNVTNPPPVRDLHDSFTDIDPLSGAIFNARKRMQFNSHVRPLRYGANKSQVISISAKLMPSWYPLGRIEANHTATDDNFAKLRAIHRILDAGFYGGIAALGLFGVLFVVFCVAVRRRRHKALIN